jgi:hypothetical protein
MVRIYFVVLKIILAVLRLKRAILLITVRNVYHVTLCILHLYAIVNETA